MREYFESANEERVERLGEGESLLLLRSYRSLTLASYSAALTGEGQCMTFIDVNLKQLETVLRIWRTL